MILPVCQVVHDTPRSSAAVRLPGSSHLFSCGIYISGVERAALWDHVTAEGKKQEGASGGRTSKLSPLRRRFPLS